MKSFYKILIPFLSTLLLFGCSYINELEIINLSSKPITVKYLLTSDYIGYFSSKPSIYGLKEDLKRDYTIEINDAIEVDSLFYTIKIQPNQTLVMGNIKNELDPSILKEDERFNLKSFVLVTGKDSICAEGGLIPFLFKKYEEVDYGLIIK